MTIGKTWLDPSSNADRPLEGKEALDLYLTEIGNSLLALTEQSELLVKALGKRAELLDEIRAERGGRTSASRAGAALGDAEIDADGGAVVGAPR